MKNSIKNCLATTGLSLVLLAAVATLYSASLLWLESVYQVFAANIVIHAGLPLLKRLESPYFMVEILAEMGYILIVIILAGSLFGWYSSTSPWVLVLMGIAVYIIGGLIDIFRINNDVAHINKHLGLRNKPMERGPL